MRDGNCGVPVNGKAEHAPRRSTPASKARRLRVLTSVECRHRSNMVGWRGLLPWLALWAVSAGPSGAYKVEKYSIAMPNVRPASVSNRRQRLAPSRPPIRRAPSYLITHHEHLSLCARLKCRLARSGFVCSKKTCRRLYAVH